VYVGDMVLILDRLRLQGVSDVADCSDGRIVKLLVLFLSFCDFTVQKQEAYKGLLRGGGSL